MLNAVLPLAVSQHHWLFAHTYHVLNSLGLVVYRSPAVRDTDPMYDDVAAFLRENRVEIAYQLTIPDPYMMFGQGEFTFYLVHSSQGSQPVAIDPKFIEDISAGGFRLIRELRGEVV